MATQFEIDCALMAGASYISTRKPLNQFPIPSEWTEQIVERAADDTGFEATCFTKGTELVISYAGTYDKDIAGDIAADVGLATGFGSIQLLQAAEYYLSLKNDPRYQGYNITLTGHSLGGGLAALIGVLFGVMTITFDQAPFASSAISGQPDVAAKLKTDLLASGHTETELAGLSNFLQLRQTNGGIPNSTKVTNYRVDGEFLSGILPFSAFNPIGNPATVLQHGPSSDLVGLDLHAQSLLAAFLQSDQSATTNTSGVKENLQQATYKLVDLLNLMFDKKMYAYRTDDNRENFLERLVRHQAGVGATSTAPAIASDAMLTRFTSDLWKLAQDGGLTMTDGNEGNPDLHQVSNALIAFAMQKYYKEKDTSVGYKAALFTDETGGIRFDMAAISEDFKNSFDANLAIDLSQAKGYVQYFDKYLETTVFSPQERALIRSSLPWMRDWYVQAGTSGMTVTDTQNRGAFMLGGSGSDALTGGAANNLLVGNAGADTLKGGAGVDLLIGGTDNDILEGGDSNDTLIGGQGNDTYKFTAGDGWDTVVDSDGLGHIEYDGITLSGGQAVGDSGMVWQKKDGQGKVQFTYILTNWTEGTETYQRLSIQGKDGGLIVKGWNPGQLGITLAGAAQITPPPVANPKISNESNLWHAATHTILDGSLIGIATTTAVGAYGEVWANGNLLGNDFDNRLGSYAENDTLSGGKGRDVLLAGMGDDQLSGGEGDDALSGGDGDDLLEGNANNDALFGGIGRDVLIGGDGADALFGGATMQASDSGWSVIQNVFNHFDGEFTSIGDGDDQLQGGIGNDFLSGGWGNDALNGGADDDQLIGDAGDDELLGGEGSDHLWGDGNESDFPDGHLPNHYHGTPDQYHGNDLLDGGEGNDFLFGNGGDDTLYGGDGNDRLFGEPPQKYSFSRMLRSTGKNGQKRNVSGLFCNADNIDTLQFRAGNGPANLVPSRVSNSLVANDTQWKVEA